MPAPPTSPASPPDPDEYAAEILAFREEKDRFFRRDDDSPLPPERQSAFRGLAYYAPDLRYRVVATVVPGDGAEVEFETTAGRKTTLRRWGRARFVLGGHALELTLFESDHATRLFVPFRDATSGKETYGGGRYLDVDFPPKNAPVELDFNLAYNPFCAYSPGFSCPLPPAENTLDAAVEAGERAFEAGP